MTNKQRLDLIEAYIREHKYADLHVLAKQFDTSLSTIRRALNELEAAGVIHRHHGGASLVEDTSGGGYDFITQDDTHAEEKHRIAARVAEIVQDGMTIMIDGGTTTYAVAKAILDKRLVIITNSLPIAALLNEVSACETILTGGTLYNRLGVLYGPLCESALEEMRVDMAILGCAGLDGEGVWNSNAMLASFQRKMIQSAQRTLIVADGSKLGKRSLTLTTRYQSRLSIVTTNGKSGFLRQTLKENGTELILC
ncbi:MAG: DeoR/GlpR family DNA-binding transcription regulator [Oceanipulchritudo sp.]